MGSTALLGAWLHLTVIKLSIIKLSVMATTRLRKAFGYPGGDDEDDEDDPTPNNMDEEGTLATKSSANLSRSFSDFYRTREAYHPAQKGE